MLGHWEILNQQALPKKKKSWNKYSELSLQLKPLKEEEKVVEEDEEEEIKEEEEEEEGISQ